MMQNKTYGRAAGAEQPLVSFIAALHTPLYQVPPDTSASSSRGVPTDPVC